jgi:hypothetical protein
MSEITISGQKEFYPPLRRVKNPETDQATTELFDACYEFVVDALRDAGYDPDKQGWVSMRFLRDRPGITPSWEASPRERLTLRREEKGYILEYRRSGGPPQNEICANAYASKEDVILAPQPSGKQTLSEAEITAVLGTFSGEEMELVTKIPARLPLVELAPETYIG